MAKTTAKKAESKSRVFLVDDHPVIRKGLASVINQESDLAVVGEAEDIHGALTAIAVARLAFTARDVEFDLTDGSVLRSLIGVVLAAATFSAIGGAVGALTTNTPMIVALLLAWVLVVEPPTVLGVPAFGRLLPAAGALALTRSPDPDLLPPVWGGVSMTVFLLVALWFAQRRLRRADL